MDQAWKQVVLSTPLSRYNGTCTRGRWQAQNLQYLGDSRGETLYLRYIQRHQQFFYITFLRYNSPHQFTLNCWENKMWKSIEKNFQPALLANAGRGVTLVKEDLSGFANSVQKNDATSGSSKGNKTSTTSQQSGNTFFESIFKNKWILTKELNKVMLNCP